MIEYCRIIKNNFYGEQAIINGAFNRNMYSVSAVYTLLMKWKFLISTLQTLRKMRLTLDKRGQNNRDE